MQGMRWAHAEKPAPEPEGHVAVFACNLVALAKLWSVINQLFSRLKLTRQGANANNRLELEPKGCGLMLIE